MAPPESKHSSFKRTSSSASLDDHATAKRHKNESANNDRNNDAVTTTDSNASVDVIETEMPSTSAEGEEPIFKPFRLMDLPPELREMIYRACLTRPFEILLSRKPRPKIEARISDSEIEELLSGARSTSSYIDRGAANHPNSARPSSNSTSSSVTRPRRNAFTGQRPVGSSFSTSSLSSASQTYRPVGAAPAQARPSLLPPRTPASSAPQPVATTFPASLATSSISSAPPQPSRSRLAGLRSLLPGSRPARRGARPITTSSNPQPASQLTAPPMLINQLSATQVAHQQPLPPHHPPPPAPLHQPVAWPIVIQLTAQQILAAMPSPQMPGLPPTVPPPPGFPPTFLPPTGLPLPGFLPTVFPPTGLQPPALFAPPLAFAAQPVFVPPPFTPEPDDGSTLALKKDPLVVTLLCANKQIYQEARLILYAENTFRLETSTASQTLGSLSQRSRGRINKIHLIVNTSGDLLNPFHDLFYLNLRYCFRLKVLDIYLAFENPATSYWDTDDCIKAFHLLRWLPQECKVTVTGNVRDGMQAMVDRYMALARDLSPVDYAKTRYVAEC